jgi:dimethylsulfone monooxygenase
VSALARGDAIREESGARCRHLRLLYACLQLQQAAAGDVGQRKIGNCRERAVQQRVSSGPSREQQIDRGHVILDGGNVRAGDRQIKTVLRQHNLPRKLRAAFAAPLLTYRIQRLSPEAMSYDQQDTHSRVRAAMGSANRLKLGLFGANSSSGRAVTMVPERWSGSWRDCVKLAQMADRAGIEFMLPIGRWKGYGGATDYQGATFETVTWACGLLAKTEGLVVFGTVHAPLIPPLIAAKEFVTADHIGEGRFGLNLVCGWNEGEFEMFGATLRDHDERYAYAQEWLDIVKLAWLRREDFDFAGRYFRLRGVRAKPKPHRGARPLIMNAGASPTGQAFAIRNCDALFSTISHGISFQQTAQHVENVKTLAGQSGRNIDVYTVGVVTCRPTAREAADYYRHCVVDHADWEAVDNILAMKSITPQTHAPDEFQRIREHQANGMGGLPIVGDPDRVARDLAQLAAAGLTGIAVSFVNYLDELPYFCAEVLPRLAQAGLREKPGAI